MSTTQTMSRAQRIERLAALNTELAQQPIPAFLPGRELLEKYREAVSLTIEIVTEQEGDRL